MYIVLSTVQHYSILYLYIFLVQIQRNNDKRCKNRDKTTAFEKAFVSSVCIKKEKVTKIYIVVLISIFSFQIFGNTTRRTIYIYFHHSVSLNLRLLHLILLVIYL